ncbi:hypothetical protein AQUCO_03000226v1 [Aquilegia coerulea]|uniref:CCT domain-containing protein n=1 Tax=Aquilegia coerulea TaxID=218851 RepID=A0A2G5D1U9_AQUCA|nr:hypothetical protein AQUCO_03000226v1 [Aquilegia coerulea]
MARYNSSLRSPKMEEQQVPDTISSELLIVSTMDEIDIMDELDEIWGFSEDHEESIVEGNICSVFGREFMDWDDLLIEDGKQVKDEYEKNTEEEFVPKKMITRSEWLEEQTCYSNVTKEVISGFWDEVEKCTSLNLNLSLNYQEVMDAWSDRGSLWAEDYSPSLIKNNYMGEVPIMQEDRTEREARVLRYKEKRQNRLFSKKIRYQVRKTNADQRPRLKGRFVKRV